MITLRPYQERVLDLNFNRLVLTEEAVNKLPLAPAGKVVLYRDTKLTGFGLRVGETTAAYFVEKRVEGRNVRHTLGRRGQITADQARKVAQLKLGEMTFGKNLNAERKAKRSSSERQQIGTQEEVELFAVAMAEASYQAIKRAALEWQS
jgi:hypothetical protein